MTKRFLLLSTLFLLVVLSAVSHAQLATVTVPGTANPWLSGMPDGTDAISFDSAPDHSPLEVPGIDFNTINALTFTNVTGGVLEGPGCPSSCSPVEGSGLISHSGGAEHGISAVRLPINALIGVFLTDAQPDTTAAPEAIDFSAVGLDFATLSPSLKQVFFIGDGMDAMGNVQTFIIPDGATRLFLGTMDGFGWYNNSGSITVDVNAAGITAPTTYPIDIQVAGGGTVVCNPNPVVEGEDSVCTLTPDAELELTAFTDDGMDALTDASDGSYTVMNVTAARTLTATFGQVAVVPVGIPTLGQGAMVVLGLLLVGIGSGLVRRNH